MAKAETQDVLDGPAGEGRGPRSPGYPACSLKEALARAQRLKDYSPSRKPVPIDSALKALGDYSPKSGAGMQMVASLKKFGLVQDAGSRDTRSVQLSELAFKILVDKRPESSERDALIRTAALSPKIHAEIRERWPHGLPTDATLDHWLTSERGFNEKAVGRFLSDLRATFEYAKLDSMSDVADDVGGKADTAEMVQSNPNFTPAPLPIKGALPLPVLMDDGTFQVVQIPRMSERAFQFFKGQLEMYKPAIIAHPPTVTVAPAAQDKPPQA